MKKSILLLLFLYTGWQLTAQISKVETYQIGTQIDYYIGECGNDIPEAQGKLSFCDRAGNLAVVEESLGLNGRGTLVLLPNYYNDSEVYVTRNGLSIRHADGSWENVPNVAFENPELTSWNNTGAVRDGFVKPDGTILLYVNQASRYVHKYNLITKEISISENTSSVGGSGISGLIYDEVSGRTFAFAVFGGGRSLLEFTDPGFILLNDSNEIFEVFQDTNSRAQVIKDGILYSGNLNGLFAIPIDNPLTITKYDADETGILPFDQVNDFEITDDGTFWLAQESTNNGGITKFNLSTQTYDLYELDNPGGSVVDLQFQTLAIGNDGIIHTTARNYFGLITLDASTPEGIWTITEDEDLTALGVPITYNPNEVYAINGAIYYITNDFSTGNSTNYEVVIRDGDTWTGRNDNAPGNISFWMIERFREAHPSPDGGSIWSNSLDDIIVTVDSDDRFTSDIKFNPSGLQSAVDADSKLVQNIFVPGESTDVRKVIAPTTYAYPTENNGGTRAAAQYNDQIWVFNKDFGTIEIYIQDNLVQTYILDPAISLSSYFRIAIDSNGIFWALKSSFPSATLLRFDRTTEELTEITLTSDFGPTGGIEVSPDGGIWLLSSTDAIFYKDDMEYAFPNDLFDFGTIEDGQVDTNGKMHIITVGGFNGDIHTIENPSDSDPIIESVNLVNNTSESLLPTENTSGTDDIIIDTDGDYWINSSRGFYKIIDDDPTPSYRTNGITTGIISGRLYDDVNENEQYDEGEAIAGVSISLVADGSVQNTITDGEGIYRIFAKAENTPHTVVVNTLDDDFILLDRIQQVAVTTLDQNYGGNDFVVDIKDYNSIFYKQGQRIGVWGFDRQAFDNTFTLAITNMSTSKTFNELSTTFLFENKDGGELPEILDVTFTKIDPNGLTQLHSKIAINPKNGRWSLPGISTSTYVRTEDNSIPYTLTEETGKRRVLFTIPEIAPRDTWVVEINTDIFDPTQNGTVIITTTESTSSPDYEDANEVPPGGDVYIMYPEEERDYDYIPLPSEDLNSPYIDPSDPPQDGTFVDPSEVYSPAIIESPIYSAYDPNDKMVEGGNTLEINETDIARKWLTYTIRFENTGNFSAKDVYILDELDENIIPNSFTLLETSAAVEIDFLPSGENLNSTLRFSFNDIFLPFDDENNDGWVKFRVRVKDDIAEETIVSNTAEIYFDQNPAIITNTIQNLFKTPEVAADTEAPMMVCQNVTISLDENGQASIVASDIDNGSTDNFGIESLELDSTTFDCSNLGENTVTLTGTDAAGNSASCEATVTVIDEMAPTAICQNITVTLDDQGEVSIDVDQINNGSFDNCDSVGLDLSNFSFTCDDLGENTVTLFVTDSSGNASTCEATVTVVDDTEPNIICNDLTVSLDADGMVTILPSDIDNFDSTDNCGEVTRSLDIDTFTCDNLGENTVTFNVTDSNGNATSCEVIVTVIDEDAPEFDETTLPEDQEVSVNDDMEYEVEDFTTDILFTDNCGATITQNPAVGEILTPDIYVFTITIMDADGNITTHTFEVTVTDNLSINDASQASIMVYPNPVSETLYIESSLATQKVQMYDLSGRLVKEGQDIHQIDVTTLPAGMYLLQVQSANRVQSFKIIKR